MKNTIKKICLSILLLTGLGSVAGCVEVYEPGTYYPTYSYYPYYTTYYPRYVYYPYPDYQNYYNGYGNCYTTCEYSSCDRHC